jgi:hypothetical protein
MTCTVTVENAASNRHMVRLVYRDIVHAEKRLMEVTLMPGSKHEAKVDFQTSVSIEEGKAVV